MSKSIPIWLGVILVLAGAVGVLGVSGVVVRPDDPSPGVFFGNTVAMSGDLLVAGAPFDQDRGVLAGAAYSFRGSALTWQQEIKLSASDGARYDQFGEYVAAENDWIVVTARRPVSGDGNSPGAAYMFHYDGLSWTQEQKLTGERDGDRFGSSVAIGGGVLVLGAVEAADGLGAAYIYRQNGTSWQLEQRLAGTGGFFGECVDISGNTIVVGASADRTNGRKFSGATYVFVNNGASWEQEAVLTVAEAIAARRFGVAVSIDGDRIAIGAPLDSEPLNQRGAAYVFERIGTAWTQQLKIVPEASNESDFVGRAVALQGELLAIGAPTIFNLANGPEAGSVYLYRNETSGWSLVERFFATDSHPADSFGVSIDIFGDKMAVGAIGNNTNGSGAGAAYVVTIPVQVPVRTKSWSDIKSMFSK